MRKLFGLKGQEVAEGWRKLFNGELHNSCISPTIVRMIK
jgi:hypothetical protein